jgi:hypothetical protein
MNLLWRLLMEEHQSLCGFWLGRLGCFGRGGRSRGLVFWGWVLGGNRLGGLNRFLARLHSWRDGLRFP